jgi:hypothetical protein
MHNFNQQLSRCQRDILKVCKALLVMDTMVDELLKACHRRALPVYCRISIALQKSRKQAIRGRIYNINVTESSMLLASNGPLEAPLSNTTSFTLSAAAMSFTLPVSNSYDKDPLEAKNKIRAAKIDGIKLRTKRLKRKGNTASQERYKRHSVRPQDLVLSGHKHIARGDKTNDILPDANIVYLSRAVTYLLEIGVAKGGSLSDRHQYALPVARRRMLCQRAK